MDTDSREELNKQFAEAMAGVMEWENEIAADNKRILKAIRNSCNRSFYRSLLAYLKDLSDSCCSIGQMKYEIVREVKGDWQNDNWGKYLKKVCVDQRSVGYEGDSYEGCIYIHIRGSQYFKTNYSM